MAKEPRPRRERKVDRPARKGNGDEGRPPAVKPVQPPAVKPVQPPAVKPVQPPAAKPVQPPAVKPVQPPAVKPVQPPAVKPVQPPMARPAMPPAAKPVQPGQPVAKPVQPVRRAPAQPVAAVATPVKAPAAEPVEPAGRGRRSGGARRGGRPMAEEEIGRGGRGGRGGRTPRHGSGGMSFAMKAALITGGATLLVMAIGLALAGSGPDADKTMDDAGHAAVQMLARTDVKWWAGGSTGVDPIKRTQRVFVDLFGQQGKDWWEERRNFIKTAFTQTEDWDPEEIDHLKEAKKHYTEGEDKWSGGGTDDPSKTAAKVLRKLAGPGSSVVRDPGYIVVGAWIRETEGSTGEGKKFDSYPPADRIRYEWKNWSATDRKVDGTVGGKKVTIYTGNMGKPNSKSKPLRAYVALVRNPQAPKAGGSGNLGIVLALLGPLLVGAVAYSLAAAHTKHVRSLAREIDRLGSSGDPTRMVRAQGGDAALVARAVERMVGHLEFRSKHGDADLEEIADKERKVAEEIHSALISKNPPRLSNYEVETLYKPGFEIAGDHFEYFPIDEHHLGVILLDTNVRGLPAALVMASARSYVRAAAPGELSPATVLKTVNRNLSGDLPPGRHVTALYVVIDTNEGKATIASAGHLPLIVYRHASGKVAKVNPEGIALGLDRGPVFERALQEGDIPIGVGDRIVLYTDGALNICNEYGEEFGESRFYETVTREAPKNSQAFVNFVGSAIDQFHVNVPQNDDVTISTVKRLK